MNNQLTGNYQFTFANFIDLIESRLIINFKCGNKFWDSWYSLLNDWGGYISDFGFDVNAMEKFYLNLYTKKYEN